MNCPTCGKELYDNGEERFNCPFCGAEVEGSGSAPGEEKEETLEMRCQRLERELARMKVKRAKRFATPIGEFLYRTVPSDWFSIGVRTVDYGEGGFLVASPEKALGDLLLSRSNLRISSPDSLKAFLEDDMRFDFDAFGNPDKTILREMAACGHKPLLMKAMERMFS